jgi:Zn finger protein HypA/HybF involved in hydrogenase expression
MHDTYLIKKISEEVKELCRMNQLNKLTKLVVTVNHTSHVNEENLYDKLRHMNKKLCGSWTHIQVLRDDIQEQTAILQTVEGEKGE